MHRLKTRAEFVAAQRGARTERRGFALQGRDRGDDGPARFGFTVTRKVGTAVERNRIRRRLRAAVEATDGGRRGCDYVVVARRAAIGLPFAALVEDLSGALARLDRILAERSAARAASEMSGTT
jgi:ribonuclease P protein component